MIPNLLSLITPLSLPSHSFFTSLSLPSHFPLTSLSLPSSFPNLPLDCCCNASKRHNLNNPTLSRRRSVGIRIWYIISVSKTRYHKSICEVACLRHAFTRGDS